MNRIILLSALLFLNACQNGLNPEKMYLDQDNDGYTEQTDCNDDDPNVYPDAEEFCDGVDQDCDGEVDNGVSRNFFVDFDADGFGNPNEWIVSCEETPGFVGNSLDCDDTDSQINPIAPDICDDFDNNCNGIIDEEASITFYYDWDEDGFGGSEIELLACERPDGFSENNLDCDDYDAASYPGAEEACDGLDNDCDGELDNGLERSEFYLDQDEDGYGDDLLGVVLACMKPIKHSERAGDCNDEDSNVFPGAPEQCNSFDDNCNGIVDEDVISSDYFVDADGDGYGDPSTLINDCVAPQGYILEGGDCDDMNALVSPGATEECFDGIDNNCNAELDCMDLVSCMEVEATCWICGDGYIAGDEECDDSNTMDGDGCSSLCENEGVFGLCVSDWCYQSGTIDQYTRCGSLADNGNTCIDPEIKYGTVEGGLPKQHSGNNYNTWCQQLGAQGFTTYATGSRSGYALFGCSSYDESIWHWCDWQDGYWYNQNLDSFQTSSDYITSITCN